MAESKDKEALDLIFHILQEHEEKFEALEKRLDDLKRSLDRHALILNRISEVKKEPTSAPEPPQSILVVDDDPNVVRSFKMILESAGFTVDTSNTAIDAMRKASRIHFDLIIVDMNLPDTLGDELADRLHAANPKVKILMVTGYSNYMKQLEGNSATYDVLMKPINPEELVETSKRLTQKR